MLSLPAPAPLERLDHPAARAAGVTLYCKRDDLFTLAAGTALQGNKVRKLYPTLLDAARHPERLYASFGGAYSNHLAALAVAAERFGLRAVVFVRGEEVDNEILRWAQRAGLRLRRISRQEYRLRADADWLAAQRSVLAATYGYQPHNVLFIPEGGSSPAGVRNCGGCLTETIVQLGGPPDFFCLSAGTGGTAAGVLAAAPPETHVEVFPALKGDWMRAEIEQHLPDNSARRWSVITDYHFGGYGKFPAAWVSGRFNLSSRADIGEGQLPPLEPIYTAKLFSGVLDRLRRGCYPRGSKLVVLHTGGIY